MPIDEVVTSYSLVVEEEPPDLTEFVFIAASSAVLEKSWESSPVPTCLPLLSLTLVVDDGSDGVGSGSGNGNGDGCGYGSSLGV